MNKEQITILWLDDKREPNKYFAKPSQSGAWQRNNDFYQQNIYNKYEPNYVWVKNIEEFKKYILTNGLPDMVSFDHDLTIDKNNPIPNGVDCAQWLVSYCQETNQQLPRCFVHSANKKRIPEVEKILNINENKKKIIKIKESKLRLIIENVVKEMLNK